MYSKSQETYLLLSHRNVRNIQRYRKPDLLRLIHSCIKSYQGFDIQLSGMDQPERKILYFPLQAHFIPIYNIFQV